MKRALSLVLAIAMMMSMAVTAFAAEAGSYEIADDVLLMGDNSLTMIEGVETTIFEFEPEEPGSYIFEIADANAKIGYWGGGRFFVSDQTENKSNKLEFKVNQAPGPSIMVGVSGVEGAFAMNVSAGEYEAPPVVENIMYENVHTPVKYTLPDYSLRSVNVTDGKPQKAVLDSEGYYHLDSVDGPVLVVDLTGDDVNLQVAMSTGNIAHYEKNEKGQTIRKIDYRDALTAYLSVSDGGCYPMTEDLAQIYQNYGADAGWYLESSFIFQGVIPDEDGWLFACSYNNNYTSVSGNTPVAPDPTEPEETEPTEPTPSEPAVGTEENPIFLMNLENSVTNKGTTYYQGHFSGMNMTVSGTGAFSVIYGAQTIAAVNGKVETYVESANPRMPISFAIVGNGTYTVKFEYPVGTMENPAELDLGSGAVSFEKGSQGYFLTWTAEADGTFTLEMYSENWSYVINNMTAYKYGDTHTSDDAEVISAETIDVKAGDELQIVLGSADYEAAEISFYTMFTAPAGTEENPIFFEDADYETPALETSATVPAGATQYYTGRVGGMIMTLEGKNVVVAYNGKEYAPVNGVITIEIEAGGFMAPPAVFKITNKGAAAATYAITFNYAAGTMENPAELVLDINTASVAEGSQGYFYSWIAEADGTLTIEMTCDKWSYVINNMTAFSYGDNHASDDEEVIAAETVDVKAGDEIQIVVGTPDWTAGEISFYAMFMTEAGTESNPIYFEDENYETSAVEDTLEVPAGATKYFAGRVGGMTMTLEGKDVVVAYNGKEYTPVNGVITIDVVNNGMFAPAPTFAITNKGAADAAYAVVFNYPVGTMENPAELVLDINTATVAEGSQGYFYSWIAEADGTLTIEMTCDKWNYVINNMTTFSYGNNHASDDEEVISAETVEVKAGDEIQIVVGTPDWTAGEVSFYAMFTLPVGTEENPIFFEDADYETPALEASATVPAGATQYYTGRVGGMIMTLEGKDVVVSYNGKEYTPVNGVITIEVEPGGMMAPPAVFKITNKGAAAANYAITFNYAAGTMENPAELVMGSNTAYVKEGSNGYYFTWTAEADGALTITMPAGDWMYAVNNMTSYIYGDTQWSDSDPVMQSYSVDVKAGDEIQIMVSTYNPANEWETPAGELIIDAEFSSGNPVAFYGSSMTLGNKLDMSFFVYKEGIEGADNYAVITKHYADGRADAVVTVAQKDWVSYSNMYFFTFSGLRAKEMADEFDVIIYNADGEAISDVFTDSVQGYVRRKLNDSATPAEHKTLYIEMLNYGAAAQVEFKYDAGNLANSVITAEEQAAYGMKDRVYENHRQSDAAYVGTTLTLENQIVFNIFFKSSYVPEGAYAVATFTNHKGQKMEETVTSFATALGHKYASFKSLVVADCSELITVKLYDANGKLISTVVDSIEGYAARMTEVGPLYEAIMKFADAAYAYFH